MFHASKSLFYLLNLLIGLKGKNLLLIVDIFNCQRKRTVDISAVESVFKLNLKEMNSNFYYRFEQTATTNFQSKLVLQLQLHINS